MVGSSKVGVEPPPHRFLSSALCNSRARSFIPGSGGVLVQQRSPPPFPLTHRQRRPKKSGPPALGAGGFREEVPCFRVGWLVGSTPDQGIKVGLFKDEIA